MLAGWSCLALPALCRLAPCPLPHNSLPLASPCPLPQALLRPVCMIILTAPLPHCLTAHCPLAYYLPPCCRVEGWAGGGGGRGLSAGMSA